MTEGLGPDAATLATALDQQASDQLWASVDDAATASVSRGPTMILASVRPPRREARVASIPPPGMALLGPWITALMLVDERLGKAAYTKHEAQSGVRHAGCEQGNGHDRHHGVCDTDRAAAWSSMS